LQFYVLEMREMNSIKISAFHFALMRDDQHFQSRYIYRMK
jgi:hypothetical protein